MSTQRTHVRSRTLCVSIQGCAFLHWTVRCLLVVVCARTASQDAAFAGEIVTGCQCNADVDADGAVDSPDGEAVIACSGGDCTACINSCDVNCDGVVDDRDLSAVDCQFRGFSPEVCCAPFCCLPSKEVCFEIPSAAQCILDVGGNPVFDCALECLAGVGCGDEICDPSLGESSCTCPADCGPPTPREQNCDDGLDDDCDGAVDCNDNDCLASPPCTPVIELELAQISIESDDIGFVPDSDYVELVIIYLPPPVLLQAFLNVVVDVGRGPGWLVRNVPILGQEIVGSEVQRVATVAPLTRVGVNRGESLAGSAAQIGFTLSKDPLPTDPVPIEIVEMQLTGVAPIRVKFNDEGGVAVDEGEASNVANNQCKNLPVPSCDDRPEKPEPEGDTKAWAWRNNLANNDVGHNQCTPASMAISFHWLAKQYPDDIALPAADANTMQTWYDTLEKFKVDLRWSCKVGVYLTEIIPGKLRFLQRMDKTISEGWNVEYQAKSIPGAEFPPVYNVGGMFARRDGGDAPPTFDFILSRLSAGADMELHVGWYKQKDDGTMVRCGGHSLAIRGALQHGNKRYIWTTDDSDQEGGRKSDGTPESTQQRCAHTKPDDGVAAQDGGLRDLLSQVLIDDDGYMTLSGLTALNRVEIVSAESPPTGCCLPDGSCVTATATECADQGGIRVAKCLGDADSNGVDDACEEVDCCLPDGTCISTTKQQCAARAGSVVTACLGDANTNGVDDACEVNCCFPGGACSPKVTTLACEAGGGTVVAACTPTGPEACCYLPFGTCTMEDPVCCAISGGIPQGLGSVCLGDANENGADDLCEAPPFFWKGGNDRPMYDFDQKQDAWGNECPPDNEFIYTWCGPVALANSLCWYDSYVWPGLIPDEYRRADKSVDPVKLIEAIADAADNGDPGCDGVTCSELERIAREWIDAVKPGVFEVHAVPADDFNAICDELRRSQDVILLLGYYEFDENFDIVRTGGHFVTLAGCGEADGRPSIAFSDPYWDSNAVGATGGRSNGPHGDVREDPNNAENHNDTSNYSHDIFPVVPDEGGCLGVDGYTAKLLDPFDNQNPGPEQTWTITQPGTFIDWVFAVSPIQRNLDRPSADPVTPIADPTGEWHELWPNFCNEWSADNWFDNGTGVLDECDYLRMEKGDVQPERWYHVERVTATLLLIPKDDPSIEIYMDLYDDQPLETSLFSPVATRWHEVFPVYCRDHNLDIWEDDGDGRLGPGDQVTMHDKESGAAREYAVERIATDIDIVPQKPRRSPNPFGRETPSDPGGGVAKSRFASIKPPTRASLSVAGAAVDQAIRVRLVSLNHPPPDSVWTGPVEDFSDFEGRYRWLGHPVSAMEDTDGRPGFVAASLQCCPVFRDWTQEALEAEFGAGVDAGIIHVFGREITPSSVYEIQLVDVTCPDLTQESCYSEALVVETGHWADIVAPFASSESRNGQNDFTDIAAVVDAFVAGEFAPIKAQAMLRGSMPPIHLQINFTDIATAVDAFTGVPYIGEMFDCTCDPDWCCPACASCE